MNAKGVVAAGHPRTVEAAAEMLRAGGNAFDAAIAAFFMSCVAEPVLASLGGGGFVLAQESGGVARVFDFFTQTPGRRRATSDLDFYPVVVDFGSAQQEFHVGLGACAVPGCVRGMFDVHRQLGRLPMREIVQPAVEAARDGITVNAFHAYIFTLVHPIYMTPSAKPLFESSKLPAHIAIEGETLRFQDLADTMEMLAIEGDDLFYRGEIAQRAAHMCANGGGHLTRQDFESYRVESREPLRIRYRNADLLFNPPPSAGGSLIGFGLRLLEETDIGDLKADGYVYLRLLTEVMLQTSFARIACMEAEGVESNENFARRLLSAPFIDSYRTQVLNHHRAFRGTTQVSVIDGDGNVATMTISNGEGCGTIIPGSGVMLNNMLGEEDVNPGGFHLWQPDQRMSSMMAPTIALFPSGRIIATGSGGSNRIRTALLQLLINLIDYNMDLIAAVRNPRIHIEGEVLNIEGGMDPKVVSQLTAEFGHHRVFDDLNLFFGGAHTVVRDSNGQLLGEGDPRRGGVSKFIA
jgi:gamma-glutamyltranspeptidase/glutathione hydrolase